MRCKQCTTKQEERQWKNCFDRTPHTMKDWLLLAAGVAAVFAAADWLPDVLRWGRGVSRAAGTALAWGLLLAYVLDIPTRLFLHKSSLAAGAAGRWPSAMR